MRSRRRAYIAVKAVWTFVFLLAVFTALVLYSLRAIDAVTMYR